MVGTNWSNEELEIIKNTYRQNIGIKKKDIAKRAYPELRKKGYFRSIVAIQGMISKNKYKWVLDNDNDNDKKERLEKNIKKLESSGFFDKDNKKENVTIDYETYEKLNEELNDLRIYKFKYYFFLLKKIFKENDIENIEWEKIESITQKMNDLSESLKRV